MRAVKRRACRVRWSRGGLAVGLFATPDAGRLSRADVDLSLRGAGADLHALAADLDGALLLDMRGGRVEADRLSQLLVGGLISEIVTTVRAGPERRDEALIDCAVLPLRFDGGRAELVPNALIRTDDANVRLDGTIDFRDERIDLSARSRPRRTLSLSAAELINPYVKFVGTLARPRAALDERGALIAGGAAALSGGLSILGRLALDRVITGDQACDQTVLKALDTFGDRLPDAPAWGAADG